MAQRPNPALPTYFWAAHELRTVVSKKAEDAAALFTVVSRQMNKAWSIGTKGHSLAIKREAIVTHTT